MIAERTNKIKRVAINNWGYIISFSFLFICLLYVLIKKDNIYIQIWDNLDSNIAWIKMLKDNDLFFTNDTTVPFLGGVNRDYLYSYFNIYAFVCMIMPTYYAIVFNWFVKVILSIVGMIFLSHTLNKDIDTNISALCGLIYGITATFPTASYGFATLPFLFALLIKIYNKPNIKYYILLAIYPVFSDLFVFGVFICGFILIFFVIDWIKTKKPKLSLLLSIVILSIGYIFVHYRLLKQLLFSSSSIRNDNASLSYNKNLFQLFTSSFEAFIEGTGHADAGQKYFILPFSIIYLAFLFFKSIKQKRINSFFKDYSFYIFVFIIFNSLVYGVDSFYYFKKIVKQIIPILSEFSFARTLWFNPFLWILLFLLIVNKIKHKSVQLFLCMCALASVIYNDARYNVVGTNIRKELKMDSAIGTETTYSDYYSCELFEEIKESINYNNEWSLAFGMHPGVIEYNGIYTLDGYLSYYPAEYKEKFRKIIEPELEIDDEHREYFDGWGGRAYVFSMETHYNTWHEEYKNISEANIYINIDAFKELNGKYIFSRVKIKNSSEIGLKLLGTYKGNYYTIYVYSI